MSWIKKSSAWKPEPPHDRARCQAQCKGPDHQAPDDDGRCIAIVNHDRRGQRSTPHECANGGWRA